MKISKIKNLFYSSNLRGVPSIDVILDEAERSYGKRPIPRNNVPKRLKKLRDALGEIPGTEGKRYTTMEDIEKISPLLAHEIKRVILMNLIEMGFEVYNYSDFKVRYGKKVSYNYYYLNLKPQTNIEDNRLALLQNQPMRIKAPEAIEVDFASPVTIKNEEIIVFYSLVLGVADLEEVKI